jgi:hypothetical protein
VRYLSTSQTRPDENVSKSSYEDELRTAAEIGASAYEKLRHPLPSIRRVGLFRRRLTSAYHLQNPRFTLLLRRVLSVPVPIHRHRHQSIALPIRAGRVPRVRRCAAALPPAAQAPRDAGTAASTTSASTPSSPASRPSVLLAGPATATPTPTSRSGQEHKFRPQSLDGKLVNLKKHMQKKSNGNGSSSNNDGSPGGSRRGYYC